MLLILPLVVTCRSSYTVTKLDLGFSPYFTFISRKNIHPRSNLNQDRLHPNRKGQYMMGNNFSIFFNSFYFWKLMSTASVGKSEDIQVYLKIYRISNIQNPNEIWKEIKNGKDDDTFSVLRKQRLLKAGSDTPMD